MTELGIPLEKSLALLFLCTACTWLIPPETFTLEDPTYEGVTLPHRIDQLHHKDVYARYPLHTQVDENISYAVQMGRKFAAWIVNRRMVNKITSLENRAMEESLTVSFVNLSEFVHVLVPLFLKSFIFYCMVYDSMFFILKDDYYNEVLEGSTKNPYDVLLESLKKCGHMKSLCAMQGHAAQVSYSSTDLRVLLYNILVTLCDDLQDVLSSAYILTPDDHLGTLIRAVKVWLYINEIEDLLHVGMPEDEFQQIIHDKYKDYPSILPVCTLTEEETTFLIRERKPGYTRAPYDPIKVPPLREDPLIGTQQRNTHGSRYHWLIGEDPVPSGLVEVSMSHRFRELVKGMNLVTLNDEEGLCFSILQHTGVFAGGYPHWEGNMDWEKDPYMISCDRCTIPWNRYAYFCNGPKTIIDIPENCLVVYTSRNTSISFNGIPSKILKMHSSSLRPVGETFFCRSHEDPSLCWVLSRDEDCKPFDPVYMCDPASFNPATALSYLRSYLLEALDSPICFSPYTHIAHHLGSVPKTISSLIISIRGKIRNIMAHWDIMQLTHPHTYEGSIERRKQNLRRIHKIQRIGSYHLLYNIIKKKPWHADGVVGETAYHVHKRGEAHVVCWNGPCAGQKPTYRVTFARTPVGEALRTWLRYCWCLWEIGEEAVPYMRAPDIRLV